MTSSPEPENHGLKFDNSIPPEFDKTSIRISLPYKDTYKLWDDWSTGKGMDTDYKEVLIASANASETYKTWYISESAIPIGEFIEIVDMITGETLSVEDTINSLPEIEPPNVRFPNEIDGYIASQPGIVQILLLNVRQAIRQTLPNATEKISWKMPTFWQNRNIIHFAAQKNHLGVYPGAEAMEQFAHRLTEYKTSKGAIQFPYNSFGDEQLKLITEIAEWCGRNNDKK